MIDKIFIRNLKVRGVIGVGADERRAAQELVINLVLQADVRAAGQSDRIADTVDYSEVTRKVAGVVESSDSYLLERLAEKIAECCLGFAGVLAVLVAIEKPTALPNTSGVGVEIFRGRLA